MRKSAAIALFFSVLLAGCHATPSPVFVGFDTGSDAPRSDQDADVQAAIDDMKSDTELHVVVIGHADATGSKEINKELSLRRARGIRTKIPAAGIEGTRVKVARGASDPIASNDTVEGREENRRTELFFFNPRNGDARAQVKFDIEVHDD